MLKKCSEMNYIKYSLLVASFSALSTTAYGIPSVQHVSDFNFKNLPAKDKFGLFLANKLSPKSFKGMPKEILAEISEYPFMAYIDNVFIDAKQLFIQASKIKENAMLPEFNWEGTYEFCIIVCMNLKLEFQTKNSSVIGGETIHSSTEVTPTSIQHSVDIPFFNWTSPGFRVTITDLDDGVINYFDNCHYSFENVSLGFGADYHFVPNVGIQLANMTIHFNADRIRGGLKEASIWDEFGLVEKYELDPTAEEIEKYWLDNWNSYKYEYTFGLEYSLNCFLSNGRSDPGNCLEDGGWDDNEDDDGKYYHLLNMQFIQTIGLSALVTG